MAKNDGKLVLIMILALVAFGIGAVAGISIGMDGIDNFTDNATDEGNIENVTEEMTTNLDQKDEYVYNPAIDDVDYNENVTFNQEN